MAAKKKTDEKPKKEKTYHVHKGFDVEARRWEPGDKLKHSHVTPANIKALLEMDAIAEVKEK